MLSNEAEAQNGTSVMAVAGRYSHVRREMRRVNNKRCIMNSG